MIKSYTAYTREMDDVDIALSEIIEQLDPEKNCLKNTVAIVTCYREFATNGIIAELHKKLKFPIIGTTTTVLATNDNVGQLDLAILMITSDDITFTAACSSSLSNELETPLTQMYQSALGGHNETPKLIISAAPLMLNYAGDSYVDILSRISGGIPNFGTLAVDDLHFEHSYVIFNGKVERDIYSIIVASGNIEPRFIYASFSPEYILPQTATITGAEGNILTEINGLPIISYLETLGLASNGKVSDMLHTVPFILDYTGEGIPVSRIMEWNTEGYGVCGGLMPQNTRFSIGVWDKSDVIGTTLHTIESIMADENISTLLLYSCRVRNYTLGTDILLEADKVNEIIVNKIPYLFAYSGGEICPASDRSDTNSIHNSFHNNTVIACAF